MHRTYSMLLKILPCEVYIQVHLSTGFAKQIMPELRILCYNGTLVTSTVVSLTIVKLKRLVYVMSRFTVSRAANIFILSFVCDFCLLPAQFSSTVVYIRKVESRVQIADRYAPWKISSGAKNLVF
jgi:hypothetical protein